MKSRNVAFTSASSVVWRAASKPLAVTWAEARASAGADESTLITSVAPPASAATEKPPV